jgi:hypothetical protein
MFRQHHVVYALLTAALAAPACSSPTEGPEPATTTEALVTSPELIAIGTLSAAIGDLATQTSAPLENGVPGNLLGGMGSGIAYAGGSTFLALPDRGPNAVAYDAAIDDTTSYIDRFHKLKLKLKANKASEPLAYTLTATLKDTTLLSSTTPVVYGTGAGLGVGNGAPALNAKKRFYLTGRSDNFDPNQLSTYPNDGRLDPESVRVSNDGESVYISDEYGPYVYEFERSSGKRVRAFSLPQHFAVPNLNPQGAVEISGNTVGRVANKGMEGLAITPDGSTLVGAMQSPLIQDGGTNGRFTRLVTIDIATGTTHEYAYELTNIGTASKPKYPTVSDIVAVNDHEFLVDERDGKGLGDDSAAAFKKISFIDLTGATEVSAISGDANLAGKAVPKSLLLDVVSSLNAQGIASTDIPAKLEGLAFGPDVVVGGTPCHTLFIANDNDFIGTVTDTNHPSGIDNPNRFFVFAIPAAALPDFVPQGWVGDDGDD